MRLPLPGRKQPQEIEDWHPRPDEMDECHRLGLTRGEYGNLGHATGPWTGQQWNDEARRRGYDELVYRLDWSR